MATRLKNLQVTRVAFVDAGANQHADVVLFKRADPTGSATDVPAAEQAEYEEGGTRMGIDKEGLDPEVLKHVEALEAERDEAVQTAADAKAKLETAEAELEKRGDTDADGESDPDAVLKSLPPEAAAILKAAQEREEALTKRLDEAEERIEAAAVEKADSAFIAKASAWRHLAVKAEDFGPVLRRLAAEYPDEVAEIERVLTSADAMASEAMLSIGKGGSSPDSALGKFQALVKSKAAADGISEPEATAAVLGTDEGAALYTQQKAEREGVRG